MNSRHEIEAVLRNEIRSLDNPVFKNILKPSKSKHAYEYEKKLSKSKYK